MLGYRRYASAEPDGARVLRRRGDKQLGACVDLAAAGVVLAHPELVLAEPVHPNRELDVPVDPDFWVFIQWVERRDEGAEAKTGRAHPNTLL